METHPDVTTSASESATRRKRIAVLITGGVVLIGAFVAIALTAGGGGGGSSSSNNAAHLRSGSGSGANPGSQSGNDGNSATTIAGSQSSDAKQSPSRRGVAGATTGRGHNASGGPTTTSKGSKLGSRTGGRAPGLGLAPPFDPARHPVPPGSKPPPPPPATPPMVQAYVTAFNAECQSIWSISSTSGGKLWDPDQDPPRTAFTVNDCLKQVSPEMAGYSFDVSDAATNGTSDAMDAASGLTWFGTLQNTPVTTPTTQKWMDPNWSSS